MTLQNLERSIKTLEKETLATVHRNADESLVCLCDLINRLSVSPIHTQALYHKYLNILKEIIILSQEKHPIWFGKFLKHRIEILTLVIREYEKQRFQAPKTTQGEMLKFLMEQNNLSPQDMSKELGDAITVSEILANHRTLTTDEITKLSKRFRISPAIFFSNID